MTVASYTGEINTNGEWATIASLTSFTFVEDTPYWIQVQNIAEIKIASAEFTVHNEKFKYTQLEDDIYIRTNERVVLTILETTENSGGGGGGTITVDSALSNSSENPVQNKVIYSALEDKLDASDYVVDSTLSSSSENPVQNKVIYPSLSNFLPSGTVINVKTDGTGDFTNLPDAISFISNKWSNGQVTLELSAETFTTSDTININSNGIPNLIIKGQGKSSTTLQTTKNATNTDWIRVNMQTVKFQDIKFTSSTGSKNSSCRGISVGTGSLVIIQNCTFQTLNPGVWTYGNGACVIQSSADFINSSTALYCSCGVIRCTYGPSIVLNDITTCFNVEAGGQIHFYSPTLTKTSVTNLANQTIGTPTANGWITGVS